MVDKRASVVMAMRRRRLKIHLFASREEATSVAVAGSS